MTPRDIELVSTLFDLEDVDAYPARAAAAASDLCGASSHRLVLQGATPEDTSTMNVRVPIVSEGETIGVLHLASPSVDARQVEATVALLGRGLAYARRLSTKGHEPSRALAESPLTPRERDVVTRLVAGASTRDISQAMTLTISTVNTYMKRIFAKLGVHSRVELVAWVNGTRT